MQLSMFLNNREYMDRRNIFFRARMLVRCDENNKLYLYDVVQIKKETSTPLE